jgi:CDP-diacylglycerol--serine O-phosphatidyltransferase
VDERVALLTGNNLNPRSWTLDLENGLVVRDPNGLLVPKHTREHAAVMRHAHRLAAYHDLDAPGSYPPIVRRALTYLDRGRVDRLLNRVL